MSYRTNRKTRGKFKRGILPLDDPNVRHMIKTGSSREWQDIEWLDQNRPDLTLVIDSQDVQQILRDEGLGDEIDDWGGLFIKAPEGEINEIWGFSGNVPDYGKIAVRLK